MSGRIVSDGRRRVLLSFAIGSIVASITGWANAQATSSSATEPPALVFTIDVRWLGSSSYRLERDVTVRIEDAVKRIPGVRKVHSTAIGARSQTSVWFDIKTDASSTASTIRAKLDQIKMRLPRDASPPLIAWHREPATAE